MSHEDFTDAAARDPRRLALAALVRCVKDERCSASFPHLFPAAVRSLPEERAPEIAARTLALPAAEDVDALTALLAPAG